jgi:hypothetical protein
LSITLKSNTCVSNPGCRLAAAPTSIGCSIFKEQASKILRSLKAKGALYRPEKDGQGFVPTILATPANATGGAAMLRCGTVETLPPQTGQTVRE